MSRSDAADALDIKRMRDGYEFAQQIAHFYGWKVTGFGYVHEEINFSVALPDRVAQFQCNREMVAALVHYINSKSEPLTQQLSPQTYALPPIECRSCNTSVAGFSRLCLMPDGRPGYHDKWGCSCGWVKEQMRPEGCDP